MVKNFRGCVCVYDVYLWCIVWLFGFSWNIDLVLSLEGSNKIVLRLLILKMVREKFWVVMFLSFKVRNLL